MALLVSVEHSTWFVFELTLAVNFKLKFKHGESFSIYI